MGDVVKSRNTHPDSSPVHVLLTFAATPTSLLASLQKPEDLKKKKKKQDSGGVIQLVDQKRAMNAGIALAKLKVSRKRSHSEAVDRASLHIAVARPRRT